jgi:hypothetical protein
MIWILACIAAVINAFLYRFGGLSKEDGKLKYPWAPEWMFKSWVRDWLIPLVITAWMLLCYPGMPWWVYVVSILPMGGALSTYWDWLFGYDNYWFHGFVFGVAKFVFAIYSGLWIGFAIHCIALALAMGGISAISGDDDVEELGRGAATGLTLPLMMI